MSTINVRKPNIDDARFARSRNRLIVDHSDGFVVERTQEITSDFLASAAATREATRPRSQRLPELMRVATIPAIFVEKWLREGFNVYREPLKEIVKKLHREGLTDFLATERSVV